MLKFIRGKGQQPSAERQRLQKELFSYKKVSFLKGRFNLDYDLDFKSNIFQKFSL